MYVDDPQNPGQLATLQDVLDACCSGDDVFLESAEFDAVANTLTLTLTDGTVIGPLDMATLVPVAVDGVTIQGDGTAVDPLVGYMVDADEATGVITITPPNGTPATFDVCAAVAANCAASLVDNGDGSFTFTGNDGAPVVWAETPLVVTTNGSATGVNQSGNSGHTVDVTTISADAGNNAAEGSDGGVFVPEPTVQVDGTTVTGDGTAANPLQSCCVADNGDGTYTVTLADGVTTFSIDTNDDGSETIVSAGAGVTVTGTGTAADPYFITNTSTGNTSSLTDNGDGTYTHDDGTGNTTTFRTCCPDNYTDNEAGSADAAGGANTVDLAMADGSTQQFCEGVTATASTDSCFWGGMGGGGYNPAGYVVRRAEIDGKTLYVDGAPEHTAICGHGFSDATVYDPPPAANQSAVNPVSVTINNLQLCRPMHVQATASFGQTNLSVGAGNDMGYTITYRLDYNGATAPGYVDGWYNTPFAFTNVPGQFNFDIAPPSYHFCAVLAPGAAATLESDAAVVADIPGGLVMAVQRTTLVLFGVTI